MTGNSWMAVKDGAQLDGKFSTEQLRQMINDAPDSNFFVWREGLSQWVDPQTLPEFKAPPPVSATQPGLPITPQPPQPSPTPPAAEKPKDEAAEKFKEGGKAILEGAAAQFGKIRDAEDSHSYLPHLKLLDGCLALARKMLSGEFLDKIDNLAKKAGNVALLVAAVFLLIGSVISGIKSSNYIMTPGIGLVTFLVLCLAQYVAIKFLDAGKVLIQKSPSRLSSSAILECIALLTLLGAIGALGGGIFMAIGMKSLSPLLSGFGGCLVLLYLTGVALNSNVVNVNVAGDASAGEEAIGIYAFVLKTYLRIVPFGYGVGMVGLALMITWAAVTLPFKSDFEFGMASAALNASSIMVIYLAIMPFAIYIAVLILYLLIDVIRSILVLPGKIDRLKD